MGKTAMTLPYPHVTHHGRRVLQCLQTPEERSGPLCVARPMVGAEVGVLKGRNAATLLARAPRLKLYLVDHWGLNGEWSESVDPRGEAILKAAEEETSFAAERRVFIKCKSPEATALVNEPLDWVFIDGDHRYEGCLADLEVWWPKIKPGGWMFGHDIDNPNPEFSHFGVRGAVEAFCWSQELSFEAWPYPEMVFAIRKPTE